MSEFFDSFNGSLPEMESEFGEDWVLNGSTFPAIAIDKLSVGSKVMHGGQLVDANVAIFVRFDIFNGSGVKKGDVVTAREQDVIVLQVESDGDDSRTLICGPSIDVWGTQFSKAPV